MVTLFLMKIFGSLIHVAFLGSARPIARTRWRQWKYVYMSSPRFSVLLLSNCRFSITNSATDFISKLTITKQTDKRAKQKSSRCQVIGEAKNLCVCVCVCVCL